MGNVGNGDVKTVILAALFGIDGIIEITRANAVNRYKGQMAQIETAFVILVAQGIGLWIGLQVFINLGVNLGLLPTKGLTLPFMSFGGTAILMNCVAMAIVLRIDVENRRLMRGKMA